MKTKQIFFLLTWMVLYFAPCVTNAQTENREVNGVAAGKRPSVTNAKGVLCDEFGEFGDGLCAVKKGAKWGFIDTVGRLIIDIIYPFSHFKYSYPVFSNGLCLIPKGMNGTEGIMYIDTKGKVVIQNPNYLQGTTFVDGFAQVQTKTQKNIYINTKGLQVFPNLTFSSGVPPVAPGKYSEGLASYYDYTKNLYGFIDAKGAIVIPSQFIQTSQFAEGMAAVYKMNSTGELMWGYIDKKGQTVIDFIFTNKPGNFSEGLAVVQTKDLKVGYLNPKGELVIQPDYSAGFPFTNGLAFVVEISHRFPIVINKEGKKTGDIPVKDMELESGFRDGVAVYSEGSGYSAGTITPDGKLVLPHYIADKMNYKKIWPFTDRRAHAMAPVDGKMVEGFINPEGDFVIIMKEAQF